MRKDRINESYISIPKKEYEDLLQNASRFNSISLTSRLWVWEVDANGIYTYCGPTVYDILGYQPEEIIGKSPFDLIIPEETERISSAFIEIIKNRAPIYNLENSNRRKDGKVVLLETNGVPFYDKSGEFAGYRGVDRDITARKKAEINLENEEKRLRTVLETIPDMIWLKDNNGVYLSCNPRFELFFGARESEIVGKTDYDFVTKDLADFFRQKDYEAMIANKPSVNLEWVTFSNDGHRELLETIKTPMYDAGNRLIGILGIARDITKHKQTEEALNESRSKLALAIDVARFGIWEYDFYTHTIILGERFPEIFGTDIADIGKSIPADNLIRKFIHPDDIQLVTGKIEEVRSSGKHDSTYQVEHRIMRPDGELRYAVTRFILLKDERGEAMRCYGAIQDVSAIKKAEMELMELNASKDKFFSIIAHDLKNPFATIIGFSEILLEKIKDGNLAETQNFAESINNSAVQTLKLLENLLEWANSQRGKILFSPTTFALSDIFTEESSNLNSMVIKKNIELRTNIPAGLLLVADKNMIRVILRNLISNAIKFTHRNGIVEVQAVTDNNFIMISVSDSGIGMTKETIAKLFRIDSGLSTRGTENEKGTGLGLFLCKEFVDKHGGKIWAESITGKGSVFTFMLPCNVNNKV